MGDRVLKIKDNSSEKEIFCNEEIDSYKRLTLEQKSKIESFCKFRMLDGGFFFILNADDSRESFVIGPDGKTKHINFEDKKSPEYITMQKKLNDPNIEKGGLFAIDMKTGEVIGLDDNVKNGKMVLTPNIPLKKKN